MWGDVLLGTPGILALLLSIFLFVQERRRYHLKLRVIIPWVWVIWNKSNESLVLFRMIFVNPALKGQIVASALPIMSLGMNRETFVYRYGENLQEATCPSPDGGYCLQLPTNELFVDALDIPAHESRSKWHGILLKWDYTEPVMEDSPLPMQFRVLDIDGKVLAVCGIGVTLEQLKTPKMHRPLKYVQQKK